MRTRSTVFLDWTGGIQAIVLDNQELTTGAHAVDLQTAMVQKVMAPVGGGAFL